MFFDCRCPIQSLVRWPYSIFSRRLSKITTIVLCLGLTGPTWRTVAQERVLGTDISYWNCGTSSTGISQANWYSAFTTGNRKFVWLRATRGGTTGVDQPQGTPGGGTLSTESRRYDDSRFVQNMVRATAAGMVAGPYHFARPDVEGNTGADEADHFVQMAGAWMRPGYLLPVFDLEAGSGSGGDALAQFSLDFSDRVYAVMKIRPGMYINGNYSSILQVATLARRNALAQPAAYTPSVVGPAYPMLWNARYSDNNNPNAIPVQTGSPKTTYTALSVYYGPWDDYGNTDPWAFWQYASTVSIPGFNAVDATVDGNVSHGDIEHVRNYLVPAVWWTDSSGDWATLANWNSGQTPVAPVTPPDQAPPYATGPLPVPRLPGATGSGPASGQYDTVILERPNANITVTHSSGSHSIRKFYMRETLNITGGTLSINYAPSYRADNSVNVLHGGPISAQFSGLVTLGGSGSLSVHTLQVDATRVFSVTGGTLAFNSIKLLPHASTPARILIGGNTTVNPLSNANAVIQNGSGSGSTGYLELGGGVRTLTVGDGANDVDLSVEVPITAGGLVKAGAGTLRLTAANTYTAGTTVSAGRLLVNNSSGSGTGTGAVTVNGGTLGGTGMIGSVVTVDAGGTISPGVGIGTLTLNNAPVLGGTAWMEINRNNGSPQADRLLLTAGTLNYSGVLVVSNTGTALVGGESFTLFAAPAYAGDFQTTTLPTLPEGLNWYTDWLTNNGSIAVNRRPTAAPIIFTNIAPAVLQIPFATLTGQATDPDLDPITLAGVTLTTTNGVLLVTNDTSIAYSYHASVLDRFSYTVSDGRGGTTTGLVYIRNIGSTPIAQFVGAPQPEGETVRLQFSATPGWTYHLQRSTDLINWKTISSIVAPQSGVVDYVDTFEDLDKPPARSLYRLSWPP